MKDWREIRTLSRDQMMKRVARFRKLKGSDGGLPDSPLPECRRKLFAVICFQPGVARRFMNVTHDEPDREHLLMFVIGGNSPQAEFTPAAMRRCEQYAADKKKPPKRV